MSAAACTPFAGASRLRVWAPLAAALVALAIPSPTASAQTRRGTYLGSLTVLEPSPGDSAWVRASAMQLRSNQRPDSLVVLYTGVRIIVGTDSTRSGSLAKWGDSVSFVTHDSAWDSTVWLGSRRGAGYAGVYAVEGGPYYGRYGTWAVNFTAGDSIIEGRAPPVGSRDSLSAYFAQLARDHEDFRADLWSPRARRSEWPFGKIIFAIWMLFLFNQPLRRGARRTLEKLIGLEATLWRRMSARPGLPKGYAVPCSICGDRNMQVARELLVIEGRGLFTSLEHCTLAGCGECVMREGFAVAGRVLLHGLWSLGGIIAAPGAVLMNVYRLFQAPNQRLAERLIREAGLDPDAVRLDEDGLVKRERLELHAAASGCARVVWADRRCAPKALGMAQQHLARMTGGRVPPHKLGWLLLDPGAVPMGRYDFDPLTRSTLYRLFKQLATADGPASARMYEVLREVMNKLNFQPNEITDLLLEVGLASRTEEQKRAEARARAHANANAGARAGASAGAGAGSGSGGGAGQSSGGGSSQSGPNPGAGGNGGAGSGQDRSGRAPRTGRDDLSRARAVLGVSANASWPEILTAYRTSISIWHPDRAGLDPRRQREFTLRSQEITWAKDALRRAANVAWT